jgi:hypothetical protein
MIVNFCDNFGMTRFWGCGGALTTIAYHVCLGILGREKSFQCSNTNCFSPTWRKLTKTLWHTIVKRCRLIECRSMNMHFYVSWDGNDRPSA